MLLVIWTKWIDEWMNSWMNEWIDEWINRWMNEPMSEGTNNESESKDYSSWCTLLCGSGSGNKNIRIARFVAVCWNLCRNNSVKTSLPWTSFFWLPSSLRESPSRVLLIYSSSRSRKCITIIFFAGIIPSLALVPRLRQGTRSLKWDGDLFEYDQCMIPGSLIVGLAKVIVRFVKGLRWICLRWRLE